MVDTALLETLELLSPAEQQAILAVAEYLKNRRTDGAERARLPRRCWRNCRRVRRNSTLQTKAYRWAALRLAGLCERIRR